MSKDYYNCEIFEEIKKLLKLGYENQRKHKYQLEEILQEFDGCLESFNDLWEEHMFGGDF